MWKPYVSHGRKQFEIGVRRNRKQGILLIPEFKFVRIYVQR